MDAGMPEKTSVKVLFAVSWRWYTEIPWYGTEMDGPRWIVTRGTAYIRSA
jgi:hypothetical protein